MRKIKAKGGSFAHVLGKGTIEIRRQKQKFIISGTDFQIIGTSPDANEKMVLQVEQGFLLEEDLEFAEPGDPTDEERQALKDKAEAEGKIDEDDTEASALKDKKTPEDEESEEQED